MLPSLARISSNAAAIARPRSCPHFSSPAGAPRNASIAGTPSRGKDQEGPNLSCKPCANQLVRKRGPRLHDAQRSPGARAGSWRRCPFLDPLLIIIAAIDAVIHHGATSATLGK